MTMNIIKHLICVRQDFVVFITLNLNPYKAGIVFILVMGKMASRYTSCLLLPILPLQN